MSPADVDIQPAAPFRRGALTIFGRRNGALRYVPVVLLALIGGLASQSGRPDGRTLGCQHRLLCQHAATIRGLAGHRVVTPRHQE